MYAAAAVVYFANIFDMFSFGSPFFFKLVKEINKWFGAIAAQSSTSIGEF